MPNTLKSVLKRTLQLMKDERIVGFRPNGSLTTIPASYFDALMCDIDVTEDGPNEGVMEERRRITSILYALKSPSDEWEPERNKTLDEAIAKINE